MTLALAFACLPSLAPVFAQENPEPPALIAQATRLLGVGKFDEAEKTLRDVLKRDDRNVDALLGMAELARIRIDYQSALGFIERAENLQNPSRKAQGDILFARGNFFLTAEEPNRALEAFQSLLKIERNDIRGLVGLANVALFQQRFAEAEEILQQAFEKNPANPAAFVTLTRLYIELNRPAEARIAAEKGLELAPNDPEAIAALCSVRVIERRPEDVRKLAERVLAINPFHSRIRRVYAQYVFTRKAYNVSPEPARQEFDAARACVTRQDLQTAKVHYRKAVESSPTFTQALLGLGAAALRTGDEALAFECAGKILAIDPENPLGQLQFSLACSERHLRQCRAIGSGSASIESVFEPVSLPPVVSEVFPDFDNLRPEEKNVLAAAVSPFAHLLPKLKHCGAKHYLLSLDRQLSDIPGYGGLADRTTFDGRYYGSLRGVGGVATVTGIEALTTAARGGFNTVAHEFAHQIHNCALDASTRNRIEILFLNAKKEKRFLDYYAAANEWEYFAQGYEAFVSVYKRPNAGVTGRHTREDLKKIDPDLFNLLLEISNPKTESVRFPTKR
jgi:tetratricopeptide (TPR) repeat protein